MTKSPSASPDHEKPEDLENIVTPEVPQEAVNLEKTPPRLPVSTGRGTASKTQKSTAGRRLRLGSTKKISSLTRHEYIDCKIRQDSTHLELESCPEDKLSDGCELWDSCISEKLEILKKLIESVQNARKTLQHLFDSLKEDEQLTKKCSFKKLQDESEIGADKLSVMLVDDVQIKDNLKITKESSNVHSIHFSTPFKHCQSSAVDFYRKSEMQLKPDLSRYRQRLVSISQHTLKRNIHIVPDLPVNAFDHVLKCVAYHEMHSMLIGKDSALLSESAFLDLFQEKDESLPKFQLNRIGIKDEDDLKLMKKFQQLMLLSKELDDANVGEKVDSANDPDDPFT